MGGVGREGKGEKEGEVGRKEERREGEKNFGPD